MLGPHDPLLVCRVWGVVVNILCIEQGICVVT